MPRHTFNFAGGEELTTMGASWFVSYSFYCYKDKSHKKWKKVSTYPSRISVFNRTKNYHRFWLQQILEMNERNLNRNKIGLEATEVKNMARELIKIESGKR